LGAFLVSFFPPSAAGLAYSVPVDDSGHLGFDASNSFDWFSFDPAREDLLRVLFPLLWIEFPDSIWPLSFPFLLEELDGFPMSLTRIRRARVAFPGAGTHRSTLPRCPFASPESLRPYFEFLLPFFFLKSGVSLGSFVFFV